MDICAAVMTAMQENGFIARKSCDFGDGRTLIKPTSSSDCCIVIFQREGQKKRQQVKCWNPTADDLLAVDWEVVTETEKET